MADIYSKTDDVTWETSGELSVLPDWTAYADLGLKALLVIAAFAIYTRL